MTNPRASFWALDHLDRGHVLTSYDLTSGSTRRTVILTPVLGKTNPLLAYDKSLTENATWWWVLSPDNRVLFAFNDSQDGFELFDVATGKHLRRINHSPLCMLFNAEIGFSNDGSLLAIKDLSECVAVWDVRNGAQLRQVASHRVLSLSGSFSLDVGYVHLTTSPRLLAYSTNDECIVRDVSTGKSVFSHKGSGVPRFLDGGQTLVVTSSKLTAPADQPVWYRRGDSGTWARLARSLAREPGRWLEFVCYSGELLVTRSTETVDDEKFEWLPSWLRDTAAHVLQTRGVRHRLEGWNLLTGQRARDLTLFELATPPFSPNDLTHGFEDRSKVSESGRWMAHRTENGTAMWDVEGRRRLFCWLTCGGLALLAAWVGWPRRGKATALAA